MKPVPEFHTNTFECHLEGCEHAEESIYRTRLQMALDHLKDKHSNDPAPVI